jgi:hypothetical protein
MLFFLFLLIIIAALCTSYYFTNKMSAQRKQILLLKYQNNDLNQASKNAKNKNITVEYIFPLCTKGVIKKRCELFICPMIDSAILNFLTEDTFVKVEDSANINNELWYEISLITEERVNTKGWIKENSIKLQEDVNE